MSVTGRGAIAQELLHAAIREKEFPAAVPDTPANRELFARIQAEIEALPPGVVPDVPADYAHGS